MELELGMELTEEYSVHNSHDNNDYIKQHTSKTKEQKFAHNEDTVQSKEEKKE